MDFKCKGPQPDFADTKAESGLKLSQKSEKMRNRLCSLLDNRFMIKNMTTENLNRFSSLIKKESKGLLIAWRDMVKKLPIAKDLDNPTLNDHIPDLIEELSYELSIYDTDKTLVEELKKSPVTHGLDRLRIGFDVEELVAEYNALRYVILDLSQKNISTLDGPETHTINRVIDKSIALAVKTYSDRKALDIKKPTC